MGANCHARVGDPVTARTVTPLEIDAVKFPSGTMVRGHVTKAEPMLLLLVFDSIEVDKTAPLPARSLRGNDAASCTGAPITTYRCAALSAS
jgi:hypothetical protein